MSNTGPAPPPPLVASDLIPGNFPGPNSGIKPGNVKTATLELVALPGSSTGIASKTQTASITGSITAATTSLLRPTGSATLATRTAGSSLFASVTESSLLTPTETTTFASETEVAASASLFSTTSTDFLTHTTHTTDLASATTSTIIAPTTGMVTDTDGILATQTALPGSNGGESEPFPLDIGVLAAIIVSSVLLIGLVVFGLVYLRRRRQMRAAEEAHAHRMAKFQDPFNQAGASYPDMQQVPPQQYLAPEPDPAQLAMEEERRARRLAEIEAVKASLRIDTEVLEAVNRYSWGTPARESSPALPALPVSAVVSSPVNQTFEHNSPFPSDRPISWVGGSSPNGPRTLRLVNNYSVPKRQSSVLLSPFAGGGSAANGSSPYPIGTPPRRSTNPFDENYV